MDDDDDDGESVIDDDKKDGYDDDDDDYYEATDMNKFHPGNLDRIGELRNLLRPHEVFLMCRNM